MFRKIKKELFFICKLLTNRYKLSNYFSYFKYRFFSGLLLAKLPVYKCQSQDDFSVHILCQEEDVNMVEWSVRSFLKYSGLCPRIIIHDDGTMTEKSARLLENRFNNLKVLFKREAIAALQKNSEFKGKIKDFSERGHKVIIQLIDIFLLSNTAKIMLLDGDVLFFKKPEEIVNFVNGNSNCDALMSRQYGSYDLKVADYYLNKYKLTEREAGFMNPGIILFNKASISVERFIEFFEHTKRKPDDYFLPMSGWGCLLSQINYRFLSEDVYIMKGRPNENTVAKHFTSPRRHEFYAYGIELAR